MLLALKEQSDISSSRSQKTQKFWITFVSLQPSIFKKGCWLGYRFNTFQGTGYLDPFQWCFRLRHSTEVVLIILVDDFWWKRMEVAICLFMFDLSVAWYILDHLWGLEMRIIVLQWFFSFLVQFSVQLPSRVGWGKRKREMEREGGRKGERDPWYVKFLRAHCSCPSCLTSTWCHWGRLNSGSILKR